MAKNILFTTSHPAPYWDIIYDDIAKSNSIVVYYDRSKDKDKDWKEQNNVKGKIESKVSFKEKFEDIKKCDFAVLGGWNYKYNLIFMFLLVILRKQFSFFSDVPDEKDITFSIKIFKKIFFFFIPYLFVTGKTGKEHYQKNYGLKDSKIKIFPYGVNFPDETKVKEKINAKILQIGREKEYKFKLFIANRFLERKGYKTVYEAFKILKEKNLLNKLDIVIAGKGEQFNEYKEKFNNLDSNIQLVGWIEFDEYNKYLEECDIYLHSSYFEPYGIPVIDAMLNGKIVIASNGVMSALDNIENGINGFIYSKFDEKELAHNLENIIVKNINFENLILNSIKIKNTFNYKYQQIISDSILGK